MSNTPLPAYIQSSRNVATVVVAAITNLNTDNPGNTTVLATGGLNGSVVFDIAVMPKATPPGANSVVLFVSDNDGGVSLVKDSIAIGTTPVTPTTAVPRYKFTEWTKDNPLFLAPGQQLRAGCQSISAIGMCVTATQGDY